MSLSFFSSAARSTCRRSCARCGSSVSRSGGTLHRARAAEPIADGAPSPRWCRARRCSPARRSSRPGAQPSIGLRPRRASSRPRAAPRPPAGARRARRPSRWAFSLAWLAPAGSRAGAPVSAASIARADRRAALCAGARRAPASPAPGPRSAARAAGTTLLKRDQAEPELARAAARRRSWRRCARRRGGWATRRSPASSPTSRSRASPSPPRAARRRSRADARPRAPAPPARAGTAAAGGGGASAATR